jgi:hypothetical protein
MEKRGLDVVVTLHIRGERGVHGEHDACTFIGRERISLRRWGVTRHRPIYRARTSL